MFVLLFVDVLLFCLALAHYDRKAACEAERKADTETDVFKQYAPYYYHHDEDRCRRERDAQQLPALYSGDDLIRILCAADRTAANGASEVTDHGTVEVLLFLLESFCPLPAYLLMLRTKP